MAIKVLLADDSITIQKVIGIIFGGAEYSLTVVDNGTAAVEKARELLPDVLLIDLNMPGLNGYQTCEAIRAIPALAAKPILLLTGSFEPFDEEKAKTCGADDFIAKPFESQQIITKVKDLYAAATAKAALLPPDTAPSAFPASFDLADDAPTGTSTLAADDIWGAFTIAQKDSGAPFSDIATDAGIFPDFGIQEPEAANSGTGATAQASSVTVGAAAASQWDDLVVDSFGAVPDADGSGDLPVDSPFDENAFDFSYREISSQPGEAESSAPVTEPIVSPPTAPAPAALTEEQLKAAISALSKDVIERIVWEVVPDLAENMIRETIRKIREGK